MLTRRERLRNATTAEIKEIARRRMAEQGTAAISLRAIAREMGMSAPGLYRYFASRDDLITALILDDYNALADAIESARDALASEAYADRLYAAFIAYRDWALAHPVNYQLILGNPIPGYHAPIEATLPAARRTMKIFVGLLEGAWLAGQAQLPPQYAELPPELAGRLVGWSEYDGYHVPPGALALTLATWGKIHGLISLELFGHVGPIIGDAGQMYRFEVRIALEGLGLQPSSPQA
jgi:AcrR family transcriptional regulator